MQQGKVIGAWSLVSFERRIDGEVFMTPLAEDPVGMLSYQPTGHVTAILSARKRSWREGLTFPQATPEEQRAAALGFLAYAGTFEIEGDKMVHHVTTSLWPDMVGTDLVRYVAWDGDDLLLLTAPAKTASGRTMQDELRWRRLT